ncbi:lipase class 3 [Colletotrichum truncatum]|uniref:Lipase class 3 n=1 Tax=Colletotrichum truncatum TaxID=5467 RepID=A0ACC3YLT1_COLTU|nr:lipase class 3 [Colletotrichum truncatum]KAF6791457.1 lipase class 3 [Colletotrichum truncatum]
MGFFDRKKVRKTPPGPGPMIRPAHPPPPPSQYAVSAMQTPQHWSQHQQHQQQPPPPYHSQQQYPVQPPPRQDWSSAHPQRNQYPQPIVVNQHYYIAPPNAQLALPAPPGSTIPRPGSAAPTQTCPLGLDKSLGIDKLTGSVATLAKDFTSPQFFEEPNFHPHATQLINSTAACVDQIAGCFNDVMTMIDGEKFSGHEKALFTYQQQPPSHSHALVEYETRRGGSGGKSSSRKKSKDHSSSKVQNAGVTASVVSGSYFSKVDMYANARLPTNLPPLRLYMPTWPLLCMAAQYAERVYDRPKGAERDTHVQADWKNGTKAMVIKSVPMDHMNTIVFAIRGSATFMDWAVNLNTALASPVNFLDDPGNFCHAGFLTVARKMIRPVAARLRQLLEEDPSRSAYSLLITGHSAGGAVASLLYSHMLATTSQAQSELNLLTGCFKRVHCVTFGTPPVSLLPLTKPDRPELRKSLFMTFVNEGDPIARADKAYVKSLLELLALPAPAGLPRSHGLNTQVEKERKSSRGIVAKASKITLRPKESSAVLSAAPTDSNSRRHLPVWELPPCTLSSPGRIVVLRGGDAKARVKDRKTVEERLNEGVIAQTVSEEQLRGVIWGDPVCHVMKLYSGRIETLAVGAVTGRHG